MAKLKFFQPRKLGKRRYPKGVCEVPDADCKGWFYEEMLKCGDISELSAAVQATHAGVDDGAQASSGGPPKPGKGGIAEEKKSSEEPKVKK